MANSEEASGDSTRKFQESPEAHLVPALTASSLPGVEVQTRAGPWAKLAAITENARSKEKGMKSQKLQPGSPQSKHPEEPGKQGTCFAPKHKVGTHS